MRNAWMRVVLTLGLVTAAGIATGSYSYASPTGSPAPEASTVVLHAVLPADLFPGSSEQVTFAADNPGSSDVPVGTVTAVVSVDARHADGCPAEYFIVRPIQSNVVVPAGATGVALGASTITFTDTRRNQDGCKGAALALKLTST